MYWHATGRRESNLPQLLDLTVEIILVSLRLGLASAWRSEAIEPSIGRWAAVLTDVEVEMVEERAKVFNESIVNNPTEPLTERC